MSSDTLYTSHASRYAEEIMCKRCKNVFEDVEGHPDPDNARVPVRLIPCGCRACRNCIRLHFQQLVYQNQQRQQQMQSNPFGSSSSSSTATTTSSIAATQEQEVVPLCCLCSQKIEITQFDEAALSLLRAAKTQMANSNPNYASSSSSVFASAGNSSATAADSIDRVSILAASGPLDFKLREELIARCKDPSQAPRAEQVARSIGSLKRALEFSKSEFDQASAERNASHESVSAKSTVISSLQHELRELDERLKAMNLDRSVLLHQLHEATNSLTKAELYNHECSMRTTEIQRRIASEAKELESRVHLIQQLAPGIPL